MDETEDNNVIAVRGNNETRNFPSRDHDISFIKKTAFGVGHFYNDLCASMWFTYLMIYLEKVLQFSSASAGFVMLIGQFTDGISTPLVGIFSDSNILPSFFNRIGKRISWHLIGTVLVSISFPFIFNKCLLCTSSSPKWANVAWLIPFVMIFQFGWASVQISHLALIPELSSISSSRNTMNSLRYAFSVIANLTVFFILAWLLSETTGHTSIGPWDFQHFKIAGMLVVGLGIAVSIVFYSFTRDPPQRASRRNSYSNRNGMLMHWTSWFRHLQFYQIGALYMLSRLYINISQVYFPFYITITQKHEKKYVAILPMVSYLSSFVVSLVISHPLIGGISKKITYIMGIVIGLIVCVAMVLNLTTLELFIVAGGIGVTQAILLITSLSITADLINRNTESGAFVYGAMSFMDKLSNGVAYQVIELYNPSCEKARAPCAIFYKNLMTVIPGVCLLLALAIILSLLPIKIGNRTIAEDLQPIQEEYTDSD